jgi:hypothetical protein
MLALLKRGRSLVQLRGRGKSLPTACAPRADLLMRIVAGSVNTEISDWIIEIVTEDCALCPRRSLN